MPNVIRHYGDLKNTRNLQGEEVQRQEYLFLKSYKQWLPCLNTDTHFVYKSNRLGSSTLCTCGSPAVVMGYDAYKKYQSYMGNEVIMCHHFFQYGTHSDGSH